MTACCGALSSLAYKLRLNSFLCSSYKGRIKVWGVRKLCSFPLHPSFPVLTILSSGRLMRGRNIHITYQEPFLSYLLGKTESRECWKWSHEWMVCFSKDLLPINNSFQTAVDRWKFCTKSQLILYINSVPERCGSFWSGNPYKPPY